MVNGPFFLLLFFGVFLVSLDIFFPIDFIRLFSVFPSCVEIYLSLLVFASVCFVGLGKDKVL